MSIDVIRSELFKLLSSEKESMYSAKDADEKRGHNTRYNVYNEYYMLIRRNSSYAYVFELKNSLLNTVLKLEKEYKELLEKYEQEKDPNKKAELVHIINEYVNKIEAHNQVYNIINRNLKSKNNDYTNYSNKVIAVISKLTHERDKEKIASLEEELYRLQEERRARLTSETDLLIIKEICELESIEARIATSSNANFTMTLTKKEFTSSLKDTIQAINEYYFLDHKKSKHYKENPDYNEEENEILVNEKFDSYVSKYYALISSAFKNNYYMIEKDDIKMSTDDLINYLSIYNLDGNYEIFRSVNRNRLIGNNDISRDEYLLKVDYLKRCVNLLLEQCSRKIRTKNIQLVNNSPTKDDLIKLRDQKLSEIENIIEGEKIHARR